jgi:hypothetical protein
MKAMRVKVSTSLPCSPDLVWAEVLKPSLLQHVAFPFAVFRFPDAGAFPERWEDGGTYYCKPFVFGLLPVGVHRLFFERIDAGQREIQIREADTLVKRWDHLIKVEKLPGSASSGATLYTDDIEIDAGWLTPIVWCWSSVFYRYRQMRWRRRVRLWYAGANQSTPDQRGLPCAPLPALSLSRRSPSAAKPTTPRKR